MIAACLSLMLVAPPTIEADPAFAMAKQLVGGKWVGEVGAMHLEFTFKLEADGKLIRGSGVGTQGGKVIVTMNSSYGWDAKAQHPYYLDQHGFDTVYFGHLKLEGKEMVTDFVGLSGDDGAYVSRMHFDDRDHYSFSMWQRTDGKLVDTHIGISLHRARS